MTVDVIGHLASWFHGAKMQAVALAVRNSSRFPALASRRQTIDAALSAVSSRHRSEPMRAESIDRVMHGLRFHFADIQVDEGVVKHSMGLPPAPYSIFLVAIVVMNHCCFEVGVVVGTPMMGCARLDNRGAVLGTGALVALLPIICPPD